LGSPNDFNDLYRFPSVKVVFFTTASAKTQTPPSCTTKQQIRRRLSSQRPSVVTMAAKDKCLAQMNKSGTAGKATKKARNPASRVDPMGAEHRVVPAIKQALSMLPQPWSKELC
jgi:predicted lipid-binding transport protein (Tim44 family)